MAHIKNVLCHDTQHNDIQCNDTQHNDTQHNNTKWDTRHNGTYYLIRVMLSVTNKFIMLSVIMFNVIMLNVVKPSVLAPLERLATDKHFSLLGPFISHK